LILDQNENYTEGRTIDDAISGLSTKDESDDKHPEKRLKAAFTAYEKNNMPMLRSDNPGLKVGREAMTSSFVVHQS
jgi:hypothetical protein